MTAHRWLTGLTVLVVLLGRPSLSRAAALFTVSDYQIKIEVHENNTYQVAERIGVDFRVPQHGIYRTLALRERLVRADGRQTSTRAQVTDIQANTLYRLTRAWTGDRQELTIRLGDAQRTVSGHQEYQLEYLFNAGRDPLSGEDEFYYNLIGPEWTTSLDNVSFQITLPKDFPSEAVGFSVGTWGTVGTDRLTYHVEERTITGQVIGQLQPGEAVTIRISLPEGYFGGAGLGPDWVQIGLVGLCLGSLGLAIATWWRWGRDEPIVETVEFYPPDGLNSTELAYAYTGQVGDEAVVSLLVYLAAHHYLKIIDTKNSFRLEKLKDYAGDNEAERLFMTGLFGGRSVVTASDLQNKFYRWIKQIKQVVATPDRRQLWWDETVRRWQIGWLSWLVVEVMIVSLIIADWSDPYFTAHLMASTVVGAVAGAVVIFQLTDRLAGWALGAVGLLLAGALGGWWLIFFTFDPDYWPVCWLAAASIGALAVIAKLTARRTTAGHELLGRIAGFRRFLQTAEKPRLEALVADNPSYFYDILPYTMALGVSQVWVGQFRSLAIAPPEWYVSPTLTSYDPLSVNRSLQRTMSSLQRTLTSVPASSSGGVGFSSGGGGISGGGHGGGGGGSW